VISANKEYRRVLEHHPSDISLQLYLQDLLGKVLDAGQLREARRGRGTVSKEDCDQLLRRDVPWKPPISPVPGLDEDLHETSLTLIKGLVELREFGDVDPVGDEELG
jgi:hypothetical protein